MLLGTYGKNKVLPDESFHLAIISNAIPPHLLTLDDFVCLIQFKVFADSLLYLLAKKCLVF